MLRFAVILSCLLPIQGFLVDSVGNALNSVVGSILSGGHPPHTVTELVDSKYLGRWYQMYASKSVALTFERNAFCVTADYGVAPDGRITVLNSDRLESVNGSLDVIHGFATKTSVIGQLSVQLETVPIAAPYWVLKLGPSTFGSEGQYQYSVVSDNFKATLFVLARDVDIFRRDYEQEVLKFLHDEGFTSALNMPIETVHNEDCIYNSIPTSS